MNQPTSNRRLYLQPDRLSLHFYRHVLGRRTIRLTQPCAQPQDVSRRVEAREIIGLMEILMHQRHRLDALLAVLEDGAFLRLLHGIHLQVEEARYRLETILDPMMDFLSQAFESEGQVDVSEAVRAMQGLLVLWRPDGTPGCGGVIEPWGVHHVLSFMKPHQRILKHPSRLVECLDYTVLIKTVNGFGSFWVKIEAS